MSAPWIACQRGLPYFVTGDGQAWTPIGHNDAISWPELQGLYRRRDVQAVRRHLQWLKDHGVTCLRVMLEYAQVRHRYLERPAGRFVPNMIKLWDDLFALCEELGLYLLVTPFDTFFTWRRWQHHPYNIINGGPCDDRRRLLLEGPTRLAIKERLSFASRRWGASPALFAWDLWNELHPAHGEDDAGICHDFITDISAYLRRLELATHGRAHLQTVSVFGPELLKTPALVKTVFHHPGLDFASTHLYEIHTIDNPADTIAPARAVGRLMRLAVQDASDLRPVMDTEHGPIHSFLDLHRVLPEPFDDEYFRHIQWAHLASGGAGGGMRWPNRQPHVLTPGMRLAQRALSRFLGLIDWTAFRRRNLNDEVRAGDGIAAFACGDDRQAVVWLLNTLAVGPEGLLDPNFQARPVQVAVPGLGPGRYRATLFDTRRGEVRSSSVVTHAGGNLAVECGAVDSDVALAIADATFPGAMPGTVPA